MRVLWRSVIIVCLSWFPLAGVAGAQDGDDLPVIGLMQTVTGRIDADAVEARWQFDGTAGESVSFLVQTASGDLDPYLQLIDDNGRLVAENDDIAYPRLDAALEQVALPRDGTYTVRVTRFGEADGTTAGDFILTRLPAYAAPLWRESFDDPAAWVPGGASDTAVMVEDGRVTVDLQTPNTLGWAEPATAQPLPLTLYAQVEAEVSGASDYWEMGLIFRQQDADNYYLFTVSSKGDWAFLARAGNATWIQIREWAAHPAVEAITDAAVLGVQMDGDTFSFFVNGELLGTAVADVHSGPGRLALSVGTVDQQANFPLVRFDNLLVTEAPPLPVDAERLDVPPLTGWEAPDSATIMAELVQQAIVPTGGLQVMLVPDSFTTVSRPGMQTLALGQGRTQTDFVLASTLTLDSDGAEDACGLLFRQDEAGYGIAFLDAMQGVGLAHWEADVFDPALYTNEDTGFAALEQVRVLLVAQGDRVLLYVNGQPVALQAIPAVTGGVGIAALSYDGRPVECRFANTWLWAWE